MVPITDQPLDAKLATELALIYVDDLTRTIRHALDRLRHACLNIVTLTQQRNSGRVLQSYL